MSAPTASTAPILLADGLSRHFVIRRGAFGGQAAAVRAVDGVNLSVMAGETLGVVGETGCGKSTLGRLLLRLIEPSAGKVVFDGEDLGTLSARAMRARRRDLQMIFQDPYSSLNPTMTVGAMLAEPLRLHGLTDRPAERVAELLRLVGLPPEHAGRWPHEFSGGQRQRIGIARALAVSPRLIVCDEVVSALDVSVQAQIINLLMDLQQRLGLTYVFIAHDLAVVRQIASRIAVMYLGRIVELAPADDLFRAPAHPYTRALLAAVPRGQPRRDASPVPRVLIEGDLPDPTHPPSGCAFHGRCPHVQARCRQEAPALMPRAAGVDHRVACHVDIESSPGERKPATVGAPDDHRIADDAAARDRLRLLMNAFIRPPGQ